MHLFGLFGPRTNKKGCSFLADRILPETFETSFNFFFETNLAQEILDMFTMADKDEDGKINYEEFLIMITPRKVEILFNYSSGQLIS